LPSWPETFVNRIFQETQFIKLIGSLCGFGADDEVFSGWSSRFFFCRFISNNPRAPINSHYLNNMPLGEQLADDLLEDIKRVLISTPQQLPAIYFRFT
jgi:hypothetical protein